MSHALGLKHRQRLIAFLLLIPAVLLLALFVGLVIPILPWWFVIGVALVPIVFGSSLYAPHMGVLFVLLLIFEVVPDYVQPRVPFGGGQLKLYDLLIVYLAFIVLLRSLAAKVSIRQSIRHYWWPLVFVFSCVAASVVYGHFFMHSKFVLADGRNFIGWLLLPLIALSVDSPSRYRLFLRGILLIAIIIATYVSIQTFFGIRIMTAARVEYLDPHDLDVVRSIAGGGTYMMVFALFYFINRVVDQKLPLLLGILPVALMISGLSVSFGRGVWIATAVGLLISTFLHRGIRGAVQATVLSGVMVAVLVSGIALVKPDLAHAIADRALGIETEVKSGGSLHWRASENTEALNSIANRPLFGVGLGGEYKKGYSLTGGSFKNETSYIHNAYLYFPLKMGWVAALAPFLLILGFRSSLRDCLGTAGQQDRGFLAATAGAFSVPVITSFTQPEWSSLQGIAAFAVLMSFTLLYRRFGSHLSSRKTS